MKIGYRRVSTQDQNVDRQMHGMVFDKEFTHYCLGGTTDREQL